MLSNMPEPVVAVVVAAGSGVRMGGSGPKALRELEGKALVALSVEALAAGGCTHAVVVVARDVRGGFPPALAGAPIPVHIVHGGPRRQDSVYNGLDEISRHPDMDGCKVVLVHDAVRPLVPAEVVAEVIRTVRAGAKAVVPTIPMADSIRMLVDGKSKMVDRASLRAVQTPQGFDRATLLEAHHYLTDQGLGVTDDASACELMGHTVELVAGSRDAMKITEPLDMMLAQTLLKLWRHGRKVR